MDGVIPQIQKALMREAFTVPRLKKLTELKP
jgi:hypothetical protein